jgi:hypothetical protein
MTAHSAERAFRAYQASRAIVWHGRAPLFDLEDGMRLWAVAGFSLIVACSEPSANSVTANDSAALNAALGVLPDGWRYTEREDRVRNTQRHLAAIVNDDADVLLDNRVVLAIQDGEYGPDVFFRATDRNSLRCYSTCGIAIKADTRTDMWSGSATADGEIVLNHPGDALQTIQRSSTLIVELDGTMSGQFTFQVAGLEWPPRNSSSEPGSGPPTR